MLKQCINIVDFKVNNKLYEDYDIFQVKRNWDKNNNDNNDSIRKCLNDIISNIVVVYNNTGIEHYVVAKKDKIKINDIKSCFANEPKVTKVTPCSYIDNLNLIELNIILLLNSSKREENGTVIVNYNYDVIIKHSKNQIMCLHCRFKKDNNNNCIYLDYGTKKYTKLSAYNEESKFKKKGPFFLVGAETMKEIPDKNKFSEDEVYVQNNPYGDSTSHKRFDIPSKDKQYIADEFYSCSVFGVIAKYIFKELGESNKYIDKFEFESIPVEEYADKKSLQANKDNISDRLKGSVFNFVYSDIEKLNILLSDLKDNKNSFEEILNIKSYTVSTEPLENCLNIVILDEDPDRSDLSNVSNQIYQKTKSNLLSNKINQHIVLSKENRLELVPLQTSLIELLIKQAIITKNISLFTHNIEKNKKYSFYMTTKKKDICLYHKITMNKDKITELKVNQKGLYDFELDEQEYLIDDIYCIVDSEGNSVKINNTKYSLLPDFSKMVNEIEMLEENNNMDVDVSFLYDLIINHIQKTKNSKHKKICEKLLEDFPEINEENCTSIKVSDIRKKYGKTSDGQNTKNVLEEIFASFGFQINAHWKSKAFSDEIYPGLRDIHYNDEYYIVSYPGSIAKSYPTGILLKHYQYNNKNIIEEILAMNNVPFVRNGILTCYPFPFKFLREAINMAEDEFSMSETN